MIDVDAARCDATGTGTLIARRPGYGRSGWALDESPGGSRGKNQDAGRYA
jgi:hypothetical protein